MQENDLVQGKRCNDLVQGKRSGAGKTIWCSVQHVCVFVCLCVCACVCACVLCTCACVCARACVYMYAYVCASMYMHVRHANPPPPAHSVGPPGPPSCVFMFAFPPARPPHLGGLGPIVTERSYRLGLYVARILF